MYGMIFVELRKYVQSRLGTEAWDAVLEAAGLPQRTYLAIDSYPDEEMNALVDASAKRTGRSRDEVLEDFGEFIAPDLIRIYRTLIPPGWSALDLIENTEKNIHRAVRMKSPTAEPPELKCERTSAQVVVLTYTSARRMCALAKGIVRGIATQYREPLSISETACMLRGDPQCTIAVRRGGP